MRVASSSRTDVAVEIGRYGLPGADRLEDGPGLLVTRGAFVSDRASSVPVSTSALLEPVTESCPHETSLAISFLDHRADVSVFHGEVVSRCRHCSGVWFCR